MRIREESKDVVEHGYMPAGQGVSPRVVVDRGVTNAMATGPEDHRW